MGQPIAKKQLGQIVLTIWENEYKGEKSYSYTVKKSKLDKQTNQWENTDFFNKSDLPLLLALVQDTTLAGINKSVIEKKAPEPVQQVQEEFQGQQANPMANNDKDIPF